jgi:hypothetical protein
MREIPCLPVLFCVSELEFFGLAATGFWGTLRSARCYRAVLLSFGMGLEGVAERGNRLVELWRRSARCHRAEKPPCGALARVRERLQSGETALWSFGGGLGGVNKAEKPSCGASARVWEMLQNGKTALWSSGGGPGGAAER